MRFIRTIAVTLTILSTPPSFALTADADKVRTCIQDICGPVDRLVNAQGAGNFSGFQPIQIKELFDTKIAPQLRLGFNVQYDMIGNFLKFWDALDETFKIESLTPEQQQLLKLAVFYGSDLTAVNKSIKLAAGGKYTIDRDKWQQLEPSRPKAQIDALASFLEYMWNDSSYETSTSIEGMPFEFFKKYFSISTEADLKANAQRNLDGMNLLQAKFGSNLILESELRVLRDVSRTGRLELFDQRMYVKAVAHYYSMNSFVSDSALAIFKDYPVTAADLRAVFAPQVQQLRALLADAPRVQALEAKALANCQKKVNGFMSSVPSEFAVDRAKRMAGYIRSAALLVAPRFFTGKDLETVKTTITTKTGFSFPDSSKSAANILLRYFQEDYNDLHLFREKSNDALDALNRNGFFISALFNLFGDKESIDEGLLNYTQNSCDAIEAPSLTDKALSEKGDILVSWQSVLWPEYGAPIMAHELGHVVSSAVGHNAFREAIDCKLKRHSDFYTKVAETNHDEEDWADTFSSSVMRELAKTWPYVKNKGCLLLPIDKEKEDLDMLHISIVDDMEESHSTGIFRLINVQIDLGRALPASCLAVPVFKKIAEGPVCSRSIPNNRER